MKILLAGGTGFVGKELIDELLKVNHSIVLLTRSVEKNKSLLREGVELRAWDGKTLGDWSKDLEGIDAVINLCGQGIADSRWTDKYKKLIVSSRIESTSTLVQAVSKLSKKPEVFINASAVGFYGNTGDKEIDETTSRGEGFLSDVCSDWEEEAKLEDIRTVLLRIGVVIEKEGGALKKMLPPFQMLAGGPLGSGKQWFPWVHRSDVVGIILHILNSSDINGPVNVTAPGLETMSGFCSALGKTIGRPSWAPVPAFVLKLILGEMSEMLLSSQKISPNKLTKSGYKFKYEDAESALKATLN